MAAPDEAESPPPRPGRPTAWSPAGEIAARVERSLRRGGMAPEIAARAAACLLSDGVRAGDIDRCCGEAWTLDAIKPLYNVGLRPAQARALALAVLRRILPDPDGVRTWDGMRAALAGSGVAPGPRTAALAARVVDRLTDRIGDGFRHVADLVGAERMKALAKAARIARQVAEGPDLAGYQRLLARLWWVEPPSEAGWRDGSGTLFVSAHTTHLAQLTALGHGDLGRPFIVRAPALTSLEERNAQLILMVKALRGGGTALISPDGGHGRVDHAETVFGLDYPLSSSFAWVAQRTGCRVMWAHAVSDDRAGGLRLALHDLPRVGRDEDAQACARALGRALARSIEAGMAETPFDVGLPYRLGLWAEAT